MFTPRFWFSDKLSSGVALFSKTAPGHRLSEQLLQHVYVYWLSHSVELRSKEIALCSQKRQHPATVNGQTKFYWCKNRYKMVQFTKEIMMLLGASLAVMWFPLWFCLFNMHLSVQCTSCRWPEGIQSEKSSLAIMCCLLYQRVQFRYNNEVALVQVMVWCGTGDKALHEPMLIQFTGTYMLVAPFTNMV